MVEIENHLEHEKDVVNIENIHVKILELVHKVEVLIIITIVFLFNEVKHYNIFIYNVDEVVIEQVYFVFYQKDIINIEENDKVNSLDFKEVV